MPANGHSPVASTVRLAIVIYRGSPLDYQEYRHTALWIRFSDRSPAILAHVVGPVGEFQFETREEDNPAGSARFVKTVDVGYLTNRATSTQVVQALRRVPVENQSREFNCQTWVEQALKTFKEHSNLSSEAYDKGVDGMVDAITEAEDEEE